MKSEKNTETLSRSSFPTLLVVRACVHAVGGVCERVQNQVKVEGQVVLLNTLESMKTFDRKRAAAAEAHKVADDALSGRGEEDPARLNRFLVLCFADLKQYTFYYWVCVPAIKTPEPVLSLGAAPLSSGGSAAADGICKACHAFSQEGGGRRGRVPFWFVEEGGSAGDNGAEGAAEGEVVVTCRGLSEWRSCCSPGGTATVAAIDVSCADDSPGWPLRNLLFLAAARWKLKTLRVILLREEKQGGAFSPTRSVSHVVQLPKTEMSEEALLHSLRAGERGSGGVSAVGWEHNARGALGPRSVNLSSTLDPKQRASAAMDLNLKLMRWRALPELQVRTPTHPQTQILSSSSSFSVILARLLDSSWSFY